MNAVIYSRVSTDEQNLDNQTQALNAWASQLNLDIVGRYAEKESAWRAGHQKELAQLAQDAQRGRFKVVLVWALDRLSRQGALAILELINKYNAWGVKVYSYQEPWTLAPGALAEVLYALAGWAAKMESERRSERTKAGIERKQRDGWTPGRPPGAKDSKKRNDGGAKNAMSSMYSLLGLSK